MALEFDLNPTAAAQLVTDAIVVGVFADGTLSPTAAALDAASEIGRASWRARV